MIKTLISMIRARVAQLIEDIRQNGRQEQFDLIVFKGSMNDYLELFGRRIMQ